MTQKMKKLTYILVVIIGFGCAANGQKLEQPANKGEAAVSGHCHYQPYNLDLAVQQWAGGEVSLMAMLELSPGCFFVSPYSADDYRGYFQVSLDENPNLEMDATFTEHPRSSVRLDPWSKKMAHLVSENTSYTHTLHVKTEEDFEVKGTVLFVIEPQCTAENIPFMIFQRDGKLTVKIGGC